MHFGMLAGTILELLALFAYVGGRHLCARSRVHTRTQIVDKVHMCVQYYRRQCDYPSLFLDLSVTLMD